MTTIRILGSEENPRNSQKKTSHGKTASGRWSQVIIYFVKL